MTDKRKVLIVEDDRTLLGVLEYSLTREGYDVATAADGLQALEGARTHRPDLIILDLMLPKLGGFEVCRILRKEMATPVLILTAKTEENDKVTGLDLGADDYVTKPFSTRELMARVRAMLRRSPMSEPAPAGQGTVFQAGDIVVDTARHRAMIGNSTLDLAPKEFDLLVYLARNKGLVFSREHLLEKVWGYDYGGDSRTVDVHVRWLREKIEDDPAKPRRLVTVRGTGYKIEE
ncbi:MAG: response regulator transcription factor [Chloroflexi bacterium]|nr:response regulator transcription factor [Chloroflexota bacterium]